MNRPIGVALTATFSTIIFDEPFTFLMTVGIALIIGGVLLVEIGSHRADAEARFDLPVMAAGYEKVYRSVMGGNSVTQQLSTYRRDLGGSVLPLES